MTAPKQPRPAGIVTPSIEAEIALREWRRACIHEAGHAMVAAHFGGDGDAEVWPNDPDAVLNGEAAWCGRFTLYSEPGAFPHPRGFKSKHGIVPAPKDWSVLYGMAGLVAEAIDGDRADAEGASWYVEDAILAGDVSGTDAAAIGDRWSMFHVRRVHRILSARWQTVRFIAEELKARGVASPVEALSAQGV